MHASAHVIFHGRVQGVCFRAYTQQHATDAKLTGWVRNRTDGTVEARFEGKKAAIEGVIEWLTTKHPYAKVTDHDLEWTDPDGSFDRFRVRSTV